MGTKLEVVLGGLDFRVASLDNPELIELRGVLERFTSPPEAASVLDELVRFVATRAGEPEVERFRADLSEITTLESQIQDLYNESLTGGGRPQSGFAERIRPLMERQADLFDRLSRYPDVNGIESRAADIDLARETELAGGSASDVPDEDRLDTRGERTTRVPPRPRESRARTAAIDTALAALVGAPSPIEMHAARPARSYAREQYLLLRDYDPIAAAQGYEVHVTGNGLDIHFDGIEPHAGGAGFNVLEAKYNDPSVESIYSEGRGGGGAAEGSFRDEIGRLIVARDGLASVGADRIVIVTNTESGRVSIQSVLAGLGIDVAGARIDIRVHTL